jgi:hypothetical protein
MEFSNYYPGNDYLDILALDVYGRDFKQSYYDSLMALSKGKPVTLGEVGNPPTLEILKKQLITLVNDPRILSLEDLEYWKIIDPYRTVCGLPPLPLREKAQITQPDFSGEWIFNEDKSVLDNWGPSFLPYKLEINQNGNDLNIKSTFIKEFEDNRIEEENLTLDGKECKLEFQNSPRIKTANWSEKSDSLIIVSKTTMHRGGQPMEIVSTETWTLQENGKTLSIHQYSKTFWGERTTTLIFDKLDLL